MEAEALDERGRFVIRDYAARRPFASFLPGIAGPLGVPMWAFYVNRGQSIAAFGIENKDGAVVEFQPANKAYQSVPYTGFRTFLKISRSGERFYHEPFGAPCGEGAPGERSTRMAVGMNELEIEEACSAHGLRVAVLYFILPGESFPALVRRLTLENTGDQETEIELLDGLPAIAPYGSRNALLKDMSRTLEAWMEVANVAQGMPFYRLRTMAGDETEVEELAAGFFFVPVTARGTGAVPVLVDPSRVFGQNTALSAPDRFLSATVTELASGAQVTSGRTPCGFAGCTVALAPGQTWTLSALIGHARDIPAAEALRVRVSAPGYLDAKRHEAELLTRNLTDAVATRTALPLFDAYCRQNYLDNVLRGGRPVILGDGRPPRVFHLYSRKHGDLERDYNAFHLAAEYYSQGNGNYRDVNQNRRSDVWFNPSIGDFDVAMFINLIQVDGYNPLVIKGSRFTVPPQRQAELLAYADRPAELRALLAEPFTPGRLLAQLATGSGGLRISPEEFLFRAATVADQCLQAEFGEGYWVDHWTYNLDLIDAYLAVYPDRKHELLFGRTDYTFYDSAVGVAPRAARYVLAQETVRQGGALITDQDKAARIAARVSNAHAARIGGESGPVYRTTLFVKLLSLAACKFATLDPLGIGIEMEAGRPGWYDALNGLPALFGSSFPEVCELYRLLEFLLFVTRERPTQAITLPVEIDELLWDLFAHVQTYRRFANDHEYWDQVATARESYRARTRFGFGGVERLLVLSALENVLAAFLEKVGDGITRALDMNAGFPPTYFTYRAGAYEILMDDHGRPRADTAVRPNVRVNAFVPSVLPLFLEGPTRYLTIGPGQASAAAIYHAVRRGPLFDAALQMYKVNAPLDALPHAIGRARAFTPGWLENESIWLHMEYKFLLAVLRAGLYAEFWADARHALIPFLDAAVYGRSPLENSSFLASSAHPDADLHGAGFVARLSGATAEFLSMWQHVFAGTRPFRFKAGELTLTLQPALPADLFAADGTVSFTFLGQCRVTYHNPSRRDTFGPAGVVARHAALYFNDGHTVDVDGPAIGAPYAEDVRGARVRAIDMLLDLPAQGAG